MGARSRSHRCRLSPDTVLALLHRPCIRAQHGLSRQIGVGRVRVLAIDPGAKTGIAQFEADIQEVTVSLIIPNGLAGFKDWWEHQDYLDYDVLVVESFELEEGSHGIDYESPLAIIHWLESLNIPIVWQRRMQRGKDKLITPAVLKRAGLYPKRGELKEGHQVAALQHALAFLVRQRHIPTIALLHPQEES